MSTFIDFKREVRLQFERMSQHELFVLKESKDAFWDLYQNSFAPGDNEIFRERREHDCQCCKHFIRDAGQIIALIDGHRETIWDIEVGGKYQPVADALSAALQDAPIGDVFRHYEPAIGTDHNYEAKNSDNVITWDHFHVNVPSNFYIKKAHMDRTLGQLRSRHDVHIRGLLEILPDSAEMVLELIAQNSLYRGEEFKRAVEDFLNQKVIFDALPCRAQGDFSWQDFEYPIRNTVIGTLLVDLSNNVDLNEAVRMYESKVAPANYKRPTALITKGMIKKAQDKVEELGIQDSLPRRYANIDDITVNNLLFVNRDAQVALGVFEELEKEVAVASPSFDRAEEINIDTFVQNVLPDATGVEVLLENSHISHLMSLIAPVNVIAPKILKWDNNFSWSYNGDTTDSIRARVAKAGGNVTGVLRCSLSWFNYDDLDVHVIEPNGTHIHFSNKSSSTGGLLDVDMNVNDQSSREAVENITWPDKSRLLEGEYKVYVHNYTRREGIDVGFDFEIEFDGIIHSFHYPREVRAGQNVVVAIFTYSHEKGIVFGKSLTSSQSTKELWNIHTQNFHEVSVIMRSPNHWDNHAIGNKHWFFMLKDCRNPEQSRGLYNEFLLPMLNEHRKVFEVLGSKMKTPISEDQLSGLGFSSTQRNQITCRVTGKFNRVLKVNF